MAELIGVNERAYDQRTITAKEHTAERRLRRMPPQIIAEGGTVTEAGAFRSHTFLVSGALTFFAPYQVEYLIVAGGGAGAGGTAGGGGGGGVITNYGSPLQVAAGEFPLVIGLGGAASTADQAVGSNGASSSIFGVTAQGGGRGANTAMGPTAQPATDGGSGGGGAEYTVVGAPGNGIPGQGFAGAVAPVGGGGGGGGAGAVGAGRNGGAGRMSGLSGAELMYAGGGGGANNGPSGSGGAGGGGNGASAIADPGAPGSGGGGGGGWLYSGGLGGSGGSGIIIVRYRI